MLSKIVRSQFASKLNINGCIASLVLLRHSSSRKGGKDYHFTLESSESVMSVGQRDFYEKNGFLIVKNLVPIRVLKECSQRFRDICEGKVKIEGIELIKDISSAKSKATGELLYNKAQHFMWDPVFFQYVSDPQVLKYAQCFTGMNTTALIAMLINKPPDIGTKTSRHPLHQDLHYFPFRPAERIVCAWTAIENVTKENGCLVVVPGTHTGPLLPHEYPQWKNGVNGLYHGITDFEQHNCRVHLEMKAGDTVFFHPKLIHGSGANKTKGFRKAILCHYADSKCEYIDVQGTTQDGIAKEMVKMGLKRGSHVDFKGFWKYHGRHVSGTAMNL